MALARVTVLKICGWHECICLAHDLIARSIRVRSHKNDFHNVMSVSTNMLAKLLPGWEVIRKGTRNDAISEIQESAFLRRFF